MGLATRIIPTLLFKGDQLVKGTQFHPWRVVGHVEQAARIYANRAVDEIVLLDVEASRQGRGPDLALVGRVSRDYFTPLTVGGGVRSVEDVRSLLVAGADKVAIGTAAYLTDFALVAQCAAKFGSQAIVVALDVKRDRVWWSCGSHTDGLVPAVAARRIEDAGAGEILLTSIDREGLFSGYDLDLIDQIAQIVKIPVVAHGGCRDYADMASAIARGASAVAAGALFQFTDATPKGAAQYLQTHGIEVRL